MHVIHLPDDHELRHSPERAHLALLIAASTVARQAVRLMNPSLDELCPVIPRTLQAARDLVAHLDELHDHIQSYLVAWDEAIASPPSSESCPF